MLILSRKTDESIIIDDDIEVKVLEVKGDKVKIGIDAPKKIKIFRKELYKEIQNENVEATKKTTDLKKLNKFIKNRKKET